jgi:hypothetical protein
MADSDNDALSGASRDELFAVVKAGLAALSEWEWLDEPGASQTQAVRHSADVTAMATAVDAKLVGAFDTSIEWAADGHRSTAVAVRHESNQSSGTARLRVHRARKLRHLDKLAGAFSAGEITVDAADLILGLDTPGRHEALVDDQKLLVEHARDLRYPDFMKVVQTWRDLHDPDDADREAGKRDDERSVHSSKTLGGQLRIDGWLTPEAGAEFDAEIERLTDKLFDADWAEARDRLGDKATMADLRRTAPQRRHDALHQMSRRSAAYTGEDPAPRGRVVLNLHMDYGTFMAELSRHQGHPFDYPTDRLCELADGTPIVPSEALNLALGGEVRRIVFGAAGHVLDYGRSHRFFTPSLADAIRARDGRCQMPGCLLPAASCEIDHIHEHQHGGETSECNGQAHCKFHNLWKTNNLPRWRELKARDESRFKKRRPPQV